MRVALSNVSSPLVKKNVSFKSKNGYQPTAPYLRPDMNECYKAIIHSFMVDPHPLFSETDELRFKDWEARYDRQNALDEFKNWYKYLDEREKQELADRLKAYSKESAEARKTGEEERVSTHKVFSDGTSLFSSYDKNSSNGLPIIDFQWFSKRDDITGWAPETTRIRYNYNNDKRLNISSTYYKRFYNNYCNKGYELIKQNASINVENGAVKTKLNLEEQKQLKRQVENILEFAFAAKVQLPYGEIYRQLESLGVDS